MCSISFITRTAVNTLKFIFVIFFIFLANNIVQFVVVVVYGTEAG